MANPIINPWKTRANSNTAVFATNASPIPTIAQPKEIMKNYLLPILSRKNKIKIEATAEAREVIDVVQL